VPHPELYPIAHELDNVIAFVNTKSGGQKGLVVLEKLKNYLAKENIFDLAHGGPKRGYHDRYQCLAAHVAKYCIFIYFLFFLKT
jgi:hypothetical protein